MRIGFAAALAAFGGLLFSGAFFPARANITLAPLFSEHMVLQRNASDALWGKAAAKESVTVAFRGQSKTTVADAAGNWSVNVDGGAAGGPFELKFQGKNAITYSDVMVGEVWLASGQSNMAYALKDIAGPNLDSAKNVVCPKLRLMTPYYNGNHWAACDDSTAYHFSAVGYYFGKYLQADLDIPVGVMLAAVGGTYIERWMDPTSVAVDAQLPHDTAKAIGDLYRQYVAPLVGYGMRGTIWYQGENNAHFTDSVYPTWIVSNYQKRLEEMIAGWRTQWKQPFPFYIVQLPNINGAQGSAAEDLPWAHLREAQRLAVAETPNTAMVVTIDVGMADNLHPYDKWDVGRRLCNVARARLYGETSVPYAFPTIKTMVSQGKALQLTFVDADGLAAKAGAKPAGFAIAGTDGKWAWADAVISKDTVTLTSATVAAPTQVRYGWGQNPPCNLFNSAGLPASPFAAEVGHVVEIRPVTQMLRPLQVTQGADAFDLLGRKAGLHPAHQALLPDLRPVSEKAR